MIRQNIGTLYRWESKNSILLRNRISKTREELVFGDILMLLDLNDKDVEEKALVIGCKVLVRGDIYECNLYEHEIESIVPSPLKRLS